MSRKLTPEKISDTRGGGSPASHGSILRLCCADATLSVFAIWNEIFKLRRGGGRGKGVGVAAAAATIHQFDGWSTAQGDFYEGENQIFIFLSTVT